MYVDDERVQNVRRLSGTRGKTAVAHADLEVLIARESEQRRPEPGDDRGYGFEYDLEGRLVKVFADADGDGLQAPSGEPPLSEFTYDALGRRIASTDHTASGGPLMMRYYYDDQNVIAEYVDVSGTEALQRYFVHGTQYIDERAVLHDVPNNADYYYFQRELYSVEGLVNNRGHEVERYSYDAYGRPVITLISATPS
ncbi:MAG: hypothetical protein ACE5F9_00365 [Phycisphaerae bacterium]